MRLDAAEAVRRGAQALECARRGGLWQGFPTLAGMSDEWVSGFVLTHLAPTEASDVDADAARSLLARRQRETGGWGFGPAVPADADSTAWSLMALRDTLPGADVARALDALELHRVGDAYATYRPGAGIEDFIGARAGGAPGWTSPHPDVTAAVLLATQPLITGQVPRPSEASASSDRADDDAVSGSPEPTSPAVPAAARFETSLRWLVACADATGLVPSYWWRGMLYASALTLRLLEQAGRRAPEAWERAAVEGLVRLQTPSGGYRLGSDPDHDAFTTALALECWCRLAHLDDDGRRDRVADALLTMQDAGGAWSGGYVLRLPAPDVTDPARVSGWRRGAGGGNAFVPDPGGVFATAVAVHSLDLWSRPAAGPGGEPGGRGVVDPAQPTRGADETLVHAGPPETAAPSASSPPVPRDWLTPPVSS